MVFSHEAPIPLPLSAIRLDEWLFHLSEKDYKACARGQPRRWQIEGLTLKGW